MKHKEKLVCTCLFFLISVCVKSQTDTVYLNKFLKNVSLPENLGSLLKSKTGWSFHDSIPAGTYQDGESAFKIGLIDANFDSFQGELGKDMVLVCATNIDAICFDKNASCQIIDTVNYIQHKNNFYRINEIEPFGAFVVIEKISKPDTSKQFIRVLDEIPNVDIKMINGNIVNIDKLINKNKYTYIEFWGLWCEPCIQEMPNTKAFYEKYKDEITLISLNYKDSAVAVSKYLEDKDYSWHFGFSDELLNQIFMVCGFPHGVLFDPNQKLIAWRLHPKVLIDGYFEEILKNEK